MTHSSGYQQELLTHLPTLAVRWRTGELDDALFAAEYFLIWQIAKHGKQLRENKQRGGLPDEVP